MQSSRDMLREAYRRPKLIRDFEEWVLKFERRATARTV
jgi:hypothetical protein